ncbi:fimbrial biogenesis chaperone [Pantoea allii]|uniref:fimbrial biogenesis chaperone n=1 Tax=Pantoea allii TaxID=574096 RepID=UPI003D79E08E
MKPLLFSALCVLTGWTHITGSYAASLQMYPSTVNFCNQERARPVYIRNTGASPISTQIRLYKWQQIDNKDVLTPASDVISSPPMAKIPAGKEQLIRIIIPKEKKAGTYRLIVDELPDRTSSDSRSNVNFLLRYSVPVFTSCKTVKIDKAKITASISERNNLTYLVIKNSGSESIKLSNVSLASGHAQRVVNRGLMGYVLPASEMSWKLPNGLNNSVKLIANINDESTFTTIDIKK